MPIQRGRTGLDRVITHQPFNPAASDRLAVHAQLRMHVQAATDLWTRAIPARDRSSMLVKRPFADRTIPPCVEPSGTDTEQTKQAPHRIIFLLLLD